MTKNVALTSHAFSASSTGTLDAPHINATAVASHLGVGSSDVMTNTTVPPTPMENILRYLDNTDEGFELSMFRACQA